MSQLALFNAVPSGAIEVLYDSSNQPWIHRAQFGKYTGLIHIRTSIPEVMQCEQRARCDLKGGQPLAPLGRSKNSHDKFISAKLALYIAMRSDKEKVKPARTWLLDDIIPRGINQKIKENHKQALEEKDSALALLNNDLEETNHVVTLLEQENLELQHQVAFLHQRAVPYLNTPQKDNGLVVIQKNNGDNYPYVAICGQQGYVTQKIQHKMIDYPNAHIVVLAETPNAIVHYNFLRERGCIEVNPDRVRHFRLGRRYTHQQLMELLES